MPVEDLTVHYWACPFFKDGGSCSTPETAEIWIAPGTGAFDYWHEVGHVFDQQALTDQARAWMTARLGFAAGTAWDPTPAQSEPLQINAPRTPSEVFADAFAACWLGMKPGGVRRHGMRFVEWMTGYSYYPTVRQHRRICNGIAVYALL